MHQFDFLSAKFDRRFSLIVKKKAGPTHTPIKTPLSLQPKRLQCIYSYSHTVNKYKNICYKYDHFIVCSKMSFPSFCFSSVWVHFTLKRLMAPKKKNTFYFLPTFYSIPSPAPPDGRSWRTRVGEKESAGLWLVSQPLTSLLVSATSLCFPLLALAFTSDLPCWFWLLALLCFYFRNERGSFFECVFGLAIGSPRDAKREVGLKKKTPSLVNWPAFSSSSSSSFSYTKLMTHIFYVCQILR